MPKRVAETELNHENWDDEEEPEEKGVFKMTTPEIMSKRVIKTGKRRLTGNSTPLTTFSNLTAFSTKPPADASKTFSFLKSQDTAPVAAPAKDPSLDYFSKLRGLNEELVDWIKTCVAKNPSCILSPIFKDYDNYLKKLQLERDSKKEAEKPEPEKTSGASSQTETKSIFSSVKTQTSSPSIFGTPSTTPSIFGQSTTSNTFAPSTTSNTFAPSGGSSLFGGLKPFGSSPFTPSESSSTGAPPNEEEAEETPPVNEFTKVAEENAIYEQRVKVFSRKDKEYVSKGVGTLYIKEVDSKYQLIVRADTNLGNILLNILLSDGIPAEKTGKNNVLLICVQTPDSKSGPVPTLLRVKTEAEADALLNEINKCKKK